MKNLVGILLFTISTLGYSQTWNNLGNCFNPGTVEEFGVYGGKLFISGGAGPGCVGPQSSNLISFDGTYFDSLSGDLPGGVEDFQVYNNKLMCGGGFLYAGQNPFPGPYTTLHLAAWDEINWSTGNITGINSDIRALAVYNNELIVGGWFTSINSTPFNRIARWNGSQWLDVGGGFPGDCKVMCMEVYNGELYVGGQLALPGGPNNYYYNCVKWNGTQWDSVGGKWGPNWVNHFCLDTITNSLYIGGGISYVDTLSFWEVAKYDGTNITSTGRCPAFGILAMNMFQNELYVGGSGFGDTVLAKYDGTNWAPVEINPNSGVTALGVYQGNLYVGGGFSQIGTIQANNIACYGLTCPTNVGILEESIEPQFKIFPNPGKGEINIELNSFEKPGEKFMLYVYDPLGKKVLTKEFKKKTTLSSETLSKGIYVIKICDSEGRNCHSEKLIIE